MRTNATIFIACDTTDMDQCRQWAAIAGAHDQGLKLGLEFFSYHGPEGVQAIQRENPGMRLFLDLKLHDIPNTVGAAVRNICTFMAPAFITVHASGGPEMMRAAHDNCRDTTRILAVTVLTSLDADILDTIGQHSDYQAQVQRLAELAHASRLDGVVCAAGELTSIRKNLGNDLICMVPGIRPASATHDDQKRVSTPAAAIQAGASHLVIGRPITQAHDPDAALRAICREIEEAGNAATG